MSHTAPLLARILAGTCALLAAAATVSGIGTAADAPDATVMVEWWRALGFATFVVLFAYLTFRPLAVAGWAIALGNKAALTIAGLALGSAAEGALTSAAWDATLSALLVAGLASVLIARRGGPGKVSPSS